MRTWEFEGWEERLRPLEGSRGSGVKAGKPGIGYFYRSGYYPACSKHGSMNCVKGHGSDGSYWRCLVEGCNIGVKWAGLLLTREPVTWWEGD